MLRREEPNPDVGGRQQRNRGSSRRQEFSGTEQDVVNHSRGRGGLRFLIESPAGAGKSGGGQPPADDGKNGGGGGVGKAGPPAKP